MIKRITVILSLVLAALLLFAAGTYVYGFAWQRGAESAVFAIRVEQVIPEKDNTYTVLIGYEDDYWFHSCKK